MRIVPSLAPAPLPRRIAGDPLVASVLAGVLLAAVEILAIGATRPALAGTLLAVFAATGAIAGLVMLATEGIVRKVGLAAWPAAVLVALPTLAIWIPVSRTLFEGAYAATLPGAGAAPYALPPILLLGVVVAARLAAWWRRPGGSRDPALCIVLMLLLAAIWLANHELFRSGYPDLHTALTLCEIVVAALAIRTIGPADGGQLGWLARLAVAAAVAAAIVPALRGGLSGEADRRLVTNHGDDTRHLVGLWRAVLDLDRDGSAAVLGGGDCDDRDAARHPGARDLAGNQIDEDCDGHDAVPREPSPAAETQAASIAEWRALPDVTATLARSLPMNVLVVSIDALRADVIAPGAPGREDFPNLIRFLDEAVWFERAMSPAAGTDVSLTGFVTGRWNPFQPLDTTLIEAMQASGRATGVVFPREVLRYVPEPLLTRGADEVVRLITDGAKRDVGDRITAGESTDQLLELMTRFQGRSFFLWAHYFDAHEHKQIEIPAEMLAAVQPGGTETAHRYRALLKGVDAELGRLLGELEARGLAASTIVVLFSDHGESLGEDPRLPDNHGLVVYAALTRVPIALRIPGVAPRRELEPAALIDLAPTLLRLIGKGDAIAPLDGVDLLPNLLGAPEPLRQHDRALVMNEQDQWGVVVWPWKLMVRPKENLTELYDLAADPGETIDLAADEPELVRDLRSRYGEFPTVPLDRTRAGRKWREAQARPPTAPAP